MRQPRGQVATASASAWPVVDLPPTRWNALLIVMAGVILQYVWRIQEVFPVLRLIQFTALVSGGAFAVFLLSSDVSRRLMNLRHPLYRPIIAILVLAVLSIPTSVHKGASLSFVTGNLVKSVLLVGVLAASIRDRRDVERMVRVLVLGGMGYVLAALAFAPSNGGRLAGRGSYDPNDLGLFTVSSIPLCIYMMRKGASVFERMLALGAAAILLLGTVLSGSRGGFLALIAAAAYGLFMLDAVRLSKRMMVMVVGGALLVGFGGPAYWERMRTILAPQEDYNWAGRAEGGRIEVWKRGIGYMARRPLLGVGVDQFPVAEGTMAPQAQRQSFGIGWRWSAAHNAYIQIGAETGVFGLAAFVGLLWLAYREARHIGRTAPDRRDRLLGQAFGGLVVAYTVGATFLSQAYATYLYFAVGVLIGLSRVVAEQKVRAGTAAVVAQQAGAPAPVIQTSRRPPRRGMRSRPVSY